jgi:hypothetical protein
LDDDSQEIRKQSHIDQVAPENLDDDSQESSSASDADDLVIEKLLASRIKDGDPSLLTPEYLVKWLGYDYSKDNTWEPRKNLGGDASTLIKDLVREETITKAWKIAIAAARPTSTNTIDITFVDPDGMGLDFRSTGNDQCFVFSIDDGGPAMKLSNNELQIGALLVSVNEDNSYNPDRITFFCQERPLRLTFSQPFGSAQGDISPDTNESTNNGFKVISWNNGPPTWKPIHFHQGRLFSADMQRIVDAQKTTGSHSEIVHAHGSMTADPVVNGIYFVSLGVSLSDWLLGIGCLTCVGSFNHYKISTISQLFARGITDDSLREIRAGPFGHLMTHVQSEWIATAAYGVYYVYDVLSGMVDAVVNQNQNLMSQTATVGLKLKTAIQELQFSAPDWKGVADSQLTSIDQEDSNGFSSARGVSPRVSANAVVGARCRRGPDGTKTD